MHATDLSASFHIYFMLEQILHAVWSAVLHARYSIFVEKMNGFSEPSDATRGAKSVWVRRHWLHSCWLSSPLPDFSAPLYPLPPRLRSSEPQGSRAPQQPRGDPARAPGCSGTYAFLGVALASCLQVQKEVMYFQG